MTIRFTKMHGLGNDFMVIDAINQTVNFTPKQIAALAQRNTGIGFDQCLIIEPSKTAEIDFFYRIFNADGNEVGQCGNGARCLARFVHHYGLTAKKNITVATLTTKMHLALNSDNTVTIDLGVPQLHPAAIPLHYAQQAIKYDLPLANGIKATVHALSLGNPHAVSVVNHLDDLPIAKLGKEIAEHELFPQQCNAGFMEILATDHIKLRVYERGCGETLACGSGAAAAAAIGKLYYQLASTVRVSLPGGDLIVNWENVQTSLYLSGPATFVYQGVLL